LANAIQIDCPGVVQVLDGSDPVYTSRPLPGASGGFFI